MSCSEKNSSCPHCGKEIFTREVFGGIKIPIPCECQIKKWEEEDNARSRADKERKIKRLFSESGIPPLQQQCTIDNFIIRKNTSRTVTAVKRYIDVFETLKGKGLLLIGNTGSGKTHLAAAIGNALISEGKNVKYTRVTDFFYNLRNSYDNSKISEYSIIDPLRRADLLILDDLGTDAPTPWSKSMLQSLIDFRINYFKPTVITTNLLEEEIKTTIDERTADRILGCSYIFNLDTPSYRTERNDNQ